MFTCVPLRVTRAAVVRTSPGGSVDAVPPTRYQEIADELATELVGLAPGTRVAGEHSISRRFGVGRAAARSAVQELERRLLVRRVQGSGTFVNQRIDYVISQSRRPSWHGTVAAAGARPRTVVRDIACTPLPADVAARLARPAGSPAYRLVRQSYIDDLLASCSHEWLPREIVEELELAMHTVESLDEVLRQLGRVSPVRAWCRVSLDVPPPEVLLRLRMEASQPVWLVESVSRDAVTAAPVMCSSAWMRADAVRVVVEMGSAENNSPENNSPENNSPENEEGP